MLTAWALIEVRTVVFIFCHQVDSCDWTPHAASCRVQVIRYPQYALSLFDVAPSFLTWLRRATLTQLRLLLDQHGGGAVDSVKPPRSTQSRYTAFIPLYPLGASTEWYSLLLVLPRARKGLYRLKMPNALNFSFDYAIFVQARSAAPRPVVWRRLVRTIWAHDDVCSLPIPPPPPF